MKVIGLTGGIGSGKTTVAKMFRDLGVPIYFADDRAKQLMNSGKRLKSRIEELFGKKAYTASGLNRPYLASIVFKDPDKLKALNALVHPEVERDFRKWILKQDSPYVIQENALIFQTGKQDQYDAIILVTAPQRVRIRRVMKRDGVTEQQVLDRIRNQVELDPTHPVDHRIENSGNTSSCRKRVLEIHQRLLSENP